MPLSTLRVSQAVTQAELDRKLGKGKATPALSLIKYDPKYDKVMKNYMGRVVICDTMATAKV
jgi:chromosome segregation ATPase